MSNKLGRCPWIISRLREGKLLSRHLFAETGETQKNLSQHSGSPGRDSNHISPEYSYRVLSQKRPGRCVAWFILGLFNDVFSDSDHIQVEWNDDSWILNKSSVRMLRTRTGRLQGGDECCETLRFRQVLPFSAPEWNVSIVESWRSICNI
jgi:hypothetical protein